MYKRCLIFETVLKSNIILQTMKYSLILKHILHFPYKFFSVAGKAAMGEGKSMSVLNTNKDYRDLVIMGSFLYYA